MSKRDRDNEQIRAVKLAGGKPAKSKYAAKGGPQRYSFDSAKVRSSDPKRHQWK